MPAGCSELGTWAIGAYVATFSRRHAYPGRPTRLGGTVSWRNAAGGVTYTRSQLLSRRVRGDAIVNAVVWTTWIPRGGGRPERRHSDGFALVLGFEDCDAPVSTAAAACDRRASGFAAEPARSSAGT